MSDIGSLGGSSFAYAINDNGQVVGASFLADNSTVHAFLWTQASGMQDLGTLGGVDSYAYGINAGGVVVGMSNTASGYVGFLWTRNTGMLPLNLASTTAWGINSSKQVVGTWVPSAKQSGFLWTQTKGVQNLNGLVTPKNIRVGSALAINRSGQIAAFSGQHALLLTPTK